MHLSSRDHGRPAAGRAIAIAYREAAGSRVGPLLHLPRSESGALVSARSASGARAPGQSDVRAATASKSGTRRLRRLHRKTFRARAEAITWRDDVRVAVRTGTIRPQTRTTVQEAADALVAGMNDGTVLDRTGKAYKPSTRRSYEQAINAYLKADPVARMALAEVRRADVQDYVDRLRKRGLSPSRSRTSSTPFG
jgi:hypothetical protein